MTLIDDVIEQFGRSVGMQGLALRQTGTLVLTMEHMGKLGFSLIGERREDVSISLARRVQLEDPRACSRLLELCHYRTQPPFPVRAGLTQAGDLVFAVRMETSDFTLPALHQALDWLTAIHQQSEALVRPIHH